MLRPSFIIHLNGFIPSFEVNVFYKKFWALSSIFLQELEWQQDISGCLFCEIKKKKKKQNVEACFLGEVLHIGWW